MRYLMTVSYDGSRYYGYQVQREEDTIQKRLERALSKIHKGESIRVYASGRTDRGVHALGQTVHFDSSLQIPPENFKRALNAHLPDDIVVLRVERVNEAFHARFHVKEKWYQYKVSNADTADPFNRQYMYHVQRPLDYVSMKQACQTLIGTHDFTAFCGTRSNVVGDKTRTIYGASIRITTDGLIFTIRGSGFLYNMVRIIVGTLIDIGCGRSDVDTFKRAIVSKDRKDLGKTAPAHGLYLYQVLYDENDKKL